MEKFKISILMTLVLGIGALFCLFFMLLALLDIYQGKEPDLLNEWIVVALGLITAVLLNLAVIFTMARMLIRKSHAFGQDR